ncbi:sister chromatid cohesion protein Dcc1 [Myxozyma melibiosi]|uniref:Sister chromatid cohesion protein Dcc1 n=1 Tax=Myxozyma melibiosi TaxID=54550 RepID=A0ABR1F1X9_9ASCO
MAQEITLYPDTSKISHFHLLQLTPDIQQLLDSPDETSHLTIKSAGPTSPIFLCSYSKTFRIRQISQSNTILMVSASRSKNYTDDQDTQMDDIAEQDGEEEVEAEAPVGYLSQLPGSILECTSSSPQVDLSFVPLYNGADALSTTSSSSSSSTSLHLNEIKSQIPVSDYEFANEWAAALGVELPHGGAFRLSRDFVQQFLPVFVAAVSADRLDLERLEVARVFEAVKEEDEPVAVVEALLRRFSRTREEPYCVDREGIARWFGIQTLSDHAYKETKLGDFLSTWHASLPQPLDYPPCSLSLLTGHYVQPTPKTIRYLPCDRLPLEPAARFERLFAAKGAWAVEEIMPFVEGIERDKARVNALFMKFARKKSVAGKTVITKRGT